MVRHERFRPHLSTRHVAAQLLPAGAKVLDFATVFGWTIKRSVGQLVVVDGNSETRSEFAELFLIKFFLLVSDVPSLTAFPEAIALDRSRENDGG